MKLYCCNAKKWQEAAIEPYFSYKDLRVKELEKGYILPILKTGGVTHAGGVCDNEFTFVDGLNRGIPGTACAGDVNASYKPDKVSVLDETVIYGGVVHARFGHFLLEGMSRFWYIISQQISFRICFITYDNKPSKAKWFWEFMDLLHIDRKRVFFVNEACQFAKVIVPEESMHAWGRFFSKEYIIPYRFIVSHLRPYCYKKIYLARGEENTGTCYVNEKYFQDFFCKKGYVIITPEKFSVSEQVSLISGAEEVVTTMGTLSHLALFCKPGTKFTILTRTDETVLTPQLLVNEAAEIDCTIITGTYNFLYGHRYNGPVFYAPTEYFKSYVHDFFCEEITSVGEISPFGQYLDAWCSYYLEEGNIDKLRDRNIEDVLKRLVRVVKLGELSPKTCNIIKNWTDANKNHYEYINQNLRSSLEYVLKCDGSYNQYRVFADVHVSQVGWLERLPGGLLAGRVPHMLEAVRIYDEQGKLKGHYKTYSLNYGWSKEVDMGEMSGSVGKRCYLCGIAISQDKQCMFDIYYRIKWSNGVWSQWYRNGEEIVNLKEKIIGIELKLK